MNESGTPRPFRAVLREIHNDHTGHLSHPRTLATLGFVAAVLFIFMALLLEAFVSAGLIIPAMSAAGLLLGVGTANTYASQNRAARERIAELHANQTKKELKSIPPEIENKGKVNGVHARRTSRSSLSQEEKPPQEEEAPTAPSV